MVERSGGSGAAGPNNTAQRMARAGTWWIRARRPRGLAARSAAALFVLAAPAAAASPTRPSDQAATATYAGTEVCLECHGDVAGALAATPHGGPAFAHRSARGCETCHGPGSNHAADPGDQAALLRLVDLGPRDQSRVCLTCHHQGNLMLWSGSKHETRGLSCLDCHSVHAPASLDAQLRSPSTTAQCFTCHQDVRAETLKSSHHPIREGKIGCADCHNPHGAPTDKLITAASVNDQCYGCHAEKRGPFLWEHPPVRESCTNCHVPHGSNHIKLQRTSVPYICQQCHANTRHPGTLYDGFRLPTLENPAAGSNRLFNRACLDCHAAIHGSNHPSSPYLGH